VTLYECAGTVAAGTTITDWRCIRPAGAAITGGTITNWYGVDVVEPAIGTNRRGIRLGLATGGGIRRNLEVTGTAFSTFAGELFMNNGVALNLGSVAGNRVQLLRSAAGVLRMIGAGGANNEGLDWDFDTAAANNVEVTSSTGAGLQLNLAALSIGTSSADPTANWQVLFAPGAKTVTAGGDFSRRLFSASASVTINAALSNFFTDTINDPFGTIGTGSVVNAGNMLIQTAPSIGTNRYGLLITSNPSGGTLNYAFRQSNASARARFDGRLDINRGIALGGGAAATLGTIGGSGPTAAAQAQWVEIDVGGVAHWIPVWT
jgi:hypothetical protein